MCGLVYRGAGLCELDLCVILTILKSEGLMDNMLYDAAGEGWPIRKKILFVLGWKV